MPLNATLAKQQNISRIGHQKDGGGDVSSEHDEEDSGDGPQVGSQPTISQRQVSPPWDIEDVDEGPADQESQSPSEVSVILCIARCAVC